MVASLRFRAAVAVAVVTVAAVRPRNVSRTPRRYCGSTVVVVVVVVTHIKGN